MCSSSVGGSAPFCTFTGRRASCMHAAAAIMLPHQRSRRSRR
jgi:hypothetical protein